MVIIGIHNKKLQERMLRDPDITFEKVKEAGCASEASKKQMKILKGTTQQEEIQRQVVQANTSPTASFVALIITEAYKKTCMKCSGKGHFAKCCTKKFTQDVKHKSSSEDTSTSEDEFLVEMIESSSDNGKTQQRESTKKQETFTCDTTTEDWNISQDTNGSIVQYKIDTGAQVNVQPFAQYKKLQVKPILHKSDCNLTAYNGSSIPVKGKCIATIDYKHKKLPVMFIVADTNSMPILGLKISSNMNLIKRVWRITGRIPEYLQKYEDCFQQLGCLSKTYNITLKRDVKPVVDPPCRVPIALQEKLKKELHRLADWVSSLVVVEKPSGALRICLDPKNLNRAIKRHHYSLPTTEDLISKMAGAKYFTKLDASNAYWQIPVDEES